MINPTKYLEFFCSDDFANLDWNIRKQMISEFLKIDDQWKPQCFHNLDQNQLDHFTNTINGVLKTNLKHDLNAKEIVKITTSFTNNELGADLIVFYQHQNDQTISLTNLEINFGDEKLRNIDNEQMQQIFNCQNEIKWDFMTFSKNLKANFTINETQLITNLDQFLEQNCKQMQNLTINQSAILELINGITKLKFNDHYEEVKTLKYQIKPDLSLKKEIAIDDQSLQGEWRVVQVKKADADATIEIVCANQNWKLKFLLHWKYPRYVYERQWSAKCGLGTSFWNVQLSKI